MVEFFGLLRLYAIGFFTEIAMIPTNILVYPSTLGLLNAFLSVYMFLREDFFSFSSEEETVFLLREERWLDEGEALSIWLQETEGDIDVYLVDIPSSEARFVSRNMESVGDAFISACAGDLDAAANRVRLNFAIGRNVALYLLYCQALAKLIPLFDEIVMSASSDLGTFQQYCSENRSKWLSLATLLAIELGWAKDFPDSLEQNLQPEFVSVTENITRMWQHSIQDAAKQQSKQP